YENVRVIGVRAIGDLETYVNTFLQSQILTLLAFPVLIMSMMLTIFTSETSISRRAKEIRTLRSKGASFNQVFSAFIWESLFIAIISLVVGVGLALLMAPLIGATQGLFVFDPVVYVAYVEHFAMPPLALFIAAAIAMYLPAAYILHVARKIDVAEVGQPNEDVSDQGAEESGIMRYVLGMGIVLISLIIMPMMFEPIGTAAIVQILIVTLLLFVASYLGSRAMRLVTARLSSGSAFLFGEKSLYLSQSLRKRKGQFIPLMVILTLTLTTTSMLLIQSSSFDATLQNELEYALGADIRIECEPRTLAFQDTIMSYPGVYKVTPVIQTWAQVGGKTFFLEGLNPIDYMDIGTFSEESFPSSDATTILTDLNATANGIVISEYYSALWNKTIGDEITTIVGTEDDSTELIFEITGMVVSAPGFGAASATDLHSTTFGSQFGFQVGQGGFALVNLDYLMNQTAIEHAEMFLADIAITADTDLMRDTLETERGTHVYTPDGFDIAADFFAIQLFVSGINGITMIGFTMCIIMGLTAIALFLGSAVYEREPEYALFRAMGGSRKQVLSMAFGEFAGTIVAAIGISVILGLMFGFSMGILTFGISPFTPLNAEVLALPVFMMVTIIALESAVMIASCYFPARRASNADPATILRNL
ncbi:MAG: FtsX-like permease family protein, partial [Candidatus Thorarchaeota archaeon]